MAEKTEDRRKGYRPGTLMVNLIALKERGGPKVVSGFMAFKRLFNKYHLCGKAKQMDWNFCCGRFPNYLNCSQYFSSKPSTIEPSKSFTQPLIPPFRTKTFSWVLRPNLDTSST